MIHELHYYMREGFQIVFDYDGYHRVRAFQVCSEPSVKVYDGWSFNEAMVKMDAYLKEHSTKSETKKEPNYNMRNEGYENHYHPVGRD